MYQQSTIKKGPDTGQPGTISLGLHNQGFVLEQYTGGLDLNSWSIAASTQ
jgi:hypothetical protein